MYVYEHSASLWKSSIHAQTCKLKIECLKKWKICWACMYVWNSLACQGKSNIHAQTYTLNHHEQIKQWWCLRVYVWKPSACHGKWNIHAQTYMLNHHTKLKKCRFVSVYVWAWMFENPLPVMKNETYTFKHKTLKIRVSVYVWKPSVLWWKWKIHTCLAALNHSAMQPLVLENESRYQWLLI